MSVKNPNYNTRPGYKQGYEDGFRKAMEYIEHTLKRMENIAPRLKWGLCVHDYHWFGEQAVCAKCGCRTSAR